jgi:dTDP-4-dehydrorhamnose reductase
MLNHNLKVVIIGSTGAIGSALISEFCNKNIDYIAALSRSQPAIKLEKVDYNIINIIDEDSIIQTCQDISDKGPFDLIINAAGMLHNDLIKPEKSL